MESRGWLEGVRELFEGLPDEPTVQQVDAALGAWGFEVDDLNRAIVLGILGRLRGDGADNVDTQKRIQGRNDG